MLEVTKSSWSLLFPHAPHDVIDAFAAKPEPLMKAGILETRTRFAYWAANVEHECGGFTIRDLTENILYTASRMAVVWPNRFSSASDVVRRFGSAPGWQLKAFDEIYGDRMGNRPGTHDGSTFIGRGGPQVTGRDGYDAVGKLMGRDITTSPRDACAHELQPEVCAAFWSWKNLNHYADANNFVGAVKIWNGGTNGLADRRAMMAGNDPIIARLALINDKVSIANSIPAALPPASHPFGSVTWVQESLNRLAEAHLIEIPAPLETKTGIYGAKTKAAVEVFQTRYHVSPADGLAGPVTNAALAGAVASL